MRLIRSALLTTTIVGILAIGAAAQAAGTSQADFQEFGPSGVSLHGVQSVFDTPMLNDSIACPSSGTNYLQNVVDGQKSSNGDIIRIGYREFDPLSGSCAAIGVEVFAKAVLTTGSSFAVLAFTSFGTHKYAVNRLSNSDCFSSSGWCWEFRIDEVTYAECCDNVSEVSFLGTGHAGMTCRRDDGSSSACNS